jgi:putative ABC transport system permease protein
MMDIRPILAALRRHRLATLLIAMEIALACAVLCNACFLIVARLDLMKVSSGVDETSLAQLRIDCDGCNESDLNARALSALRAVPGVQSAAVINALPFGQPSGYAGITLDPPARADRHYGTVPHFYTGGPAATETIGIRPAQGARFSAGDFLPSDGSWLPADSQVWITRALADHLWPGQDPLGKEFWSGKYHFRVAGILAGLAQPEPGARGVGSAQWSIFLPMAPGSRLSGNYVVRAAPADLPRVLRDARAALVHAVPEGVLDLDQSQTLGDLRHRYFRNDRAMAGMLVGVIAALLLVTALGIVGLASFWVAQRRKQIGVRRALGATRRDILRYFQTENFLIVSFGIGLGMVLAFGLNLVLMGHYELPRLPLYYLPVGALSLWVLGQLAVLAPALRAAAVPPVVATRSV